MSVTVSRAVALDITDIRFGVHADKTRLVLDLDRVADFRAFMLDGPTRLVIDLPDFDLKDANVKPPNDAGVKSIRKGTLGKGLSRLVLDLDQPAVIRSAFVLPREGARPDRLVLDYAPVSDSVFRQALKDMHGTMDADHTVSTLQRASPRMAGANLSQTPPNRKPLSSPSSQVEKLTIVIDPGHGGRDPGAISANGVYERDITLALGKELRDQLEKTGRYEVHMTRETDVFISLGGRVRFARSKNADLFVSIHADSLRRSNVRGASVYTLSEKASDAQTAKLAARENQSDLIGGIDLSVEDQDVANILVDLAMRDSMNQSKFVANTFVDTFRARRIKLLENPHRYAGFAVLKAPDIPSVLIEAGFLSNSKEANLLTTSSHRRTIVSAIVAGIDNYFEKVKRNRKT